MKINRKTMVSDIKYCPKSNIIYSAGGSELSVSNINGNLITKTSTSDRIINLSIRPSDSNTLLVSASRKTDQFSLYDTRSNKFTLNFSIPITTNLSRYVFPDWHPGGNIFVSGENDSGNIAFFDIRFPKQVQSNQVHSKRALVCKFYDSNNLITVSSDYSMAFISF